MIQGLETPLCRGQAACALKVLPDKGLLELVKFPAQLQRVGCAAVLTVACVPCPSGRQSWQGEQERGRTSEWPQKEDGVSVLQWGWTDSLGLVSSVSERMRFG